MPLRVSNEIHQQQKKRYNERSRKFAINGHSSWSMSDIERVMKHEIPDSQLAKALGRSVQAVSMIRSRYKVAWADANVEPSYTKFAAAGTVVDERGKSWIALVMSVVWAYLYRCFISGESEGTNK